MDLFTLIKKVSKVKPSRQKINYGFANTKKSFNLVRSLANNLFFLFFRLSAVGSYLCAVWFVTARSNVLRITRPIAITLRQTTESLSPPQYRDTLSLNLSLTIPSSQVSCKEGGDETKCKTESQCSAGSGTSQVSGRSVRSSPSLHSISSVKSNGSNSSWFSVNSLSSFQCAGLDKNHKQKLRVTKY